jgi:hypothetical protein
VGNSFLRCSRCVPGQWLCDGGWQLTKQSSFSRTLPILRACRSHRSRLDFSRGPWRNTGASKPLTCHPPFQRGAPAELLALPLRRFAFVSPSSERKPIISVIVYSVVSIHGGLTFGLLLRVAMYSLSPAKRIFVFALPVILLALVMALIALSTTP